MGFLISHPNLRQHTHPALAILAGIFLSRSDIEELRSEMRSETKEVRSEMRARFDLVDAGLRYFHGSVGKLEARMHPIEKRP
jgi:hypothetical protein